MVIDPRPYQAALDQAKGTLAHDEALLKNAQAEYARYKALYDAGVVSKETMEADEAAQGQYQGAIESDKAAIETAQLQLNWCTIQSPINGKIGLRLVDPGNIITANTTNLVIINQFEPIAVYFTLPENQLPQVLQKLRGGQAPARGCLRPGRHAEAGQRLPADRRQPDRHHHRNRQAEGGLRQQGSGAVSQPVRQHSPGAGKPAQCAGGAVGGHPERQSGIVCLGGRYRRQGQTATAKMQPVKIALAEGQVTILDSGLDGGTERGGGRRGPAARRTDCDGQRGPAARPGRRRTRREQVSGSCGRHDASRGSAAGRRQAKPQEGTAVSLSPSRPFILRPVATSLLMAAILLAGCVGYQQLPVSALPEVDYPIIQVLTFYPGAGPEVMASSVTAPLERQFGQMPGLKQMTSVSSGGGSVITLEFNLDENIDVAEQEVQAAINAANSFLPTDLPNPPIYSKVNPADAPIMTLALDLGLAAAGQDRRRGRHQPGAEDFAGDRRGHGLDRRRTKALGAHSGQSGAAGRLQPEP